MDGAWAEFAQRRIVRARTVALVRGKAVLRIFLIHFQHKAVPRHLGQNGRSRDIGAQAVALDDRLHRQTEVRLAVAVDQGDIRPHPELVHGAAHREERRLQDVDLIDHLWTDDPDAVSHCFLFDLIKQKISFLLRKLLGIV